MYNLDMIVNLAMARNPVISLAEGNIDQHKGQQTTAGAYPNPDRDWPWRPWGATRRGRAGIGPVLDRTSLTEYNVVVGQPIEWPAMRTARQQVADLGVATANVGMLETQLNLASQVKVGLL